MTRLQLLLGKLAEEASEVAKIALKAQQFGLDEVKPGQPYTNAERCHLELNDLNAVVEILNEEFDFQFKTDIAHIRKKKEKIEYYANHSKNLGQLCDGCAHE